MRPSQTFDAIDYLTVKLEQQWAETLRLDAVNAQLVAALQAALGYMTNAAIDLQTGVPKRTAIATLNGGIAQINAALAKAEGKP
jgi:hypothetical protein